MTRGPGAAQGAAPSLLLYLRPVCPHPQDAKPNIIFRAKVLIFEDGTEARLENASLPDNSEELVKWAVTTYGGITSYTELENPQHIFFRLGEGRSMSLSQASGWSDSPMGQAGSWAHCRGAARNHPPRPDIVQDRGSSKQPALVTPMMPKNSALGFEA